MYDACVPWPERPKGAKDKSRGPKGLELEVGARRAPKLLVIYILYTSMFKPWISMSLCSLSGNNIMGWPILSDDNYGRHDNHHLQEK